MQKSLFVFGLEVSKTCLLNPPVGLWLFGVMTEVKVGILQHRAKTSVQKEAGKIFIIRDHDHCPTAWTLLYGLQFSVNHITVTDCNRQQGW